MGKECYGVVAFPSLSKRWIAKRNLLNRDREQKEKLTNVIFGVGHIGILNCFII